MKKLITSIILIITAFVVLAAPAYADDSSCVPTSIIGGTKCALEDGKYVRDDKGSLNCSCDDGKGSSVSDQLKLVVDIMTIGIGILGVIGITVVGIQYLTSGGSEEKTRKAKRRMFEIVIGLVAYVVLYALVKWLIPTG